jgi:hypothetical protein
MTGFFRRFFKTQNQDLQESSTPVEGEDQMTVIQARLQRVTESILENEALTANLDDEAAKVLLDWGVTLAQQIISETMELDEANAEEITYQPLRALRKMLRQINNWAAAPEISGLEKIIEQAGITYGARHLAPGVELQTHFMDQISAGLQNPAENIRQLRRLLENQTFI